MPVYSKRLVAISAAQKDRGKKSHGKGTRAISGKQHVPQKRARNDKAHVRPEESEPICDGGPTLRQALYILNHPEAEPRNHCANLLIMCDMLRPPEIGVYSSLTTDERCILHVCDMIIRNIEGHGSLDRIIEALIPVVPALGRWGVMMDLLQLVDSDAIDIEQFEVLCKMLKSSMVIGSEVGSQAWSGRRSGSRQQFLKQYCDLFYRLKYNDFMAAALLPVIFALEKLPTQIDADGQEVYRKLCGSVIWKLTNSDKPNLFPYLARAVVVCAKCGDSLDVAIVLSVLDIAQRTVHSDKYWIPRLSALFSQFDLSEDKVGEAALGFALKKTENGEFCAVEMLCEAGCWPSSVGWLLSLRSKVKETIGGLGLAHWDSCCMEQMYSHVSRRTGQEQEELAVLAKRVCENLAAIFENDNSIGGIGSWCRRGFIFCFKSKSNWLFNEYCLCPFAKALPMSIRVWLKSSLESIIKEYYPLQRGHRAEVGRFLVALRGDNPVPVPRNVQQPESGMAPGCPPTRSKKKSFVPPVPKTVVNAPSHIAHVSLKIRVRKGNNRVSDVRAETGKAKNHRVHGHLVCKHNRRKSMCTECKGGSICKHGKQRHWCPDCGGKARCEHGKQKSRCKECGGKGICQHNRLRWRCTLCNK